MSQRLHRSALALLFALALVSCALPAQAPARTLAVNVTAINPSSSRYLTLFPQNEPAPLASAVTFPAGVTRTNNTVANLAAFSRSFLVRTGLPSGSSVHVTVDVAGYVE